MSEQARTGAPPNASKNRALSTALALSLASFVVLTLLVHAGWGALWMVDAGTEQVAEWSEAQPAAYQRVLLLVEDAFGALAMTLYTTVLVFVLVARGHRREAGFAAAVMIVTALVTKAVKVTIGRQRPGWQQDADLHLTEAFPSGHASAITAFAGVVVVLVVLTRRRTTTRQLAAALAGLFVAAVCLNRLLLGRHFPSDVMGGSLLAMSCLLAGLVLFRIDVGRRADGPPHRRRLNRTSPLGRRSTW